jgi:3-oxoacyl-[acyl-carrier-protein] synthase-3
MSDVRLAAVACELPARTLTLDELQAQGLLQAAAATLRETGFECCHVSDEPAHLLAQRALARLLQSSGTPPEDVQLLVTAHVMPGSAIVPTGHAPARMEDCTRFAGPWLQDALGLVNACTLGITEMGCASLLGAVAMAHAWMDATGADTAVCVNADVMPAGHPREVLHSIDSDAACAVLLARAPRGHALLAHGHMTKGYYWDAEARRDELLASYYMTGKRLIANTLARHGLRLDNIACILPNNVSRRSWEVMAEVLRLPLERVWTANIARHGHCMASDPYINLHDAVQAGRLRRGDLALLFGFGLGAHWACSIVEI